MTNAPFTFDEFFSSGQEESISPFLTRRSRSWGKNLTLKSSLASALFLLFAYASSFTSAPLSNLFLCIVFFLSGVPALLSSLNDFKNLEINIDVLMTLAAFAAVLIGSGLEGALLLVLFETSGALESFVSRKTKSAIHDLNRLAPKFAYVVADNGTVYEKSVSEIAPGMRILVKAGEIVPLDGIVREGVSSVNLAHLTGESAPDLKEAGDEMPAGARNLDAALTIEVTRTAMDSTLTRLIQLVVQAQNAKPRMQRLLDTFGKYYAAAVIALTGLFALILPHILPVGFLGPEGSIYRAVAFLIAASPCALIIAIPTAYLSAISSCARQGILLKGGITLDALAACRQIAFDKTGTLTTGDLVCTSIVPLDPVSSYCQKDALGIAASLERHVVHPIASAIVRYAEEQNAPLCDISEFKSIPGYGLSGLISNNIPVAIGLPEHVVASPETRKKIPAEGLVAVLCIGGEIFVLTFSDSVRKQIPELIRKIREKNNLDPIILTGDNARNAEKIGALVGIEKIYSNLRPEHKLAMVGELSEKGGLAMVGDGINDAPALARATVGISMGRIGSATAQDASDVVLLNDDLHLLSGLFSKASQTRRIVKQNLTLAGAVICLASMPALLGLIPLWLAVILHEGGTLLVGLNSLRLLK